MAAFLLIGSSYDEMPEILGSQMDAPRQKARLTIAGNQTANQPYQGVNCRPAAGSADGTLCDAMEGYRKCDAI